MHYSVLQEWLLPAIRGGSSSQSGGTKHFYSSWTQESILFINVFSTSNMFISYLNIDELHSNLSFFIKHYFNFL